MKSDAIPTQFSFIHPFAALGYHSVSIIIIIIIFYSATIHHDNGNNLPVMPMSIIIITTLRPLLL